MQYKLLPKTIKYIGIAQNKAIDGQTVKVVRPDIPPTINIDVVLNTGGSNNYGFELDEDNYYVSKNNAINSSYSKCRLNIKTDVPITLEITSNSYSEKLHDYGLISKLDKTLSANNTADTSYEAKIASTSDTDYTTTSFDILGDDIEHFIELKYIKDSSVNKNNDNFKFKYNYIIKEEEN